MSDQPDTGQPSRPTGARKLLLVIGSLGLLVALASDGIAVLGRHGGFGVPGSIEAFQMAIAVALSAAILYASLDDHHAAVDLVVNRLGAVGRGRLRAVGAVALALAFATLCIGSIWVAADLWPAREVTELLAIPVAPFRLVWIACSGAAALHFAWRGWKDLRG